MQEAVTEEQVVAPSDTGRVHDTASSLERMRALIDVSQALSVQTDLDALLRLVTVEAARLLDAERATLFLVEPESNEVVAHVVAGAPFQLRLHLDAPGLVTFVARTGETINLPDAYADPRFNRAMDQRTGFHTRSLLTSPLRDRGGVIVGVLQLLNKRDGAFTSDDEELVLAVGVSAAIAIQNTRLQQDLSEQFASFIATMVATLDARDPQTAGHSARVTRCAVLLAEDLGMDGERIEFIRLAGQLHDFGKIRVPEAILTKPGALTPEEYVIMRRHVEWTQDLLERIRFSRRLRELPEIAAMHHERPDGGGYPRGLKGDALPLEARILAVADAFDALISQRYYKAGLTPAAALAILERDAAVNRVDGSVVAALRRLLERGEFAALGAAVEAPA